MFGKTNIKLSKKSGYVTDGLILHLDGIDYGGDPTKWIDLVNGDELLVNGDVTKVADGFDFNNGTIEINKIYTYAHVELVILVKADRPYQSIIATTPNTKTVLQLYTTTLQFSGAAVGSRATKITNNRLLSASCDFTKIYINGEIAPLNGTQRNQTVTFNGFRLGQYGDGTFPLHGKICAVRLYNKALTANEIAQNFAVDKVRFGI